MRYDILERVISDSIESDLVVDTTGYRHRRYCRMKLYSTDRGILTLNAHFDYNIAPAMQDPEMLRRTINDIGIPVRTHDLNDYIGSSVGRGPFAEILGLVRYEEAMPDIAAALLYDIDPEMRNYCARALGYFGKKAFRTLYEAAMKEQSDWVLDHILFAMKGNVDRSSVPYLAELAERLMKMIDETDDKKTAQSLYIGPFQETLALLSNIGSRDAAECLISIIDRYPASAFSKMADRWLDFFPHLIDEGFSDTISNLDKNRIIDKLRGKEEIQVYQSIQEAVD